MKGQQNKVTTIQKRKNKWEMNIGILLFVVILIYLVVTVFMYTTSKQVFVYEVRRGSIVKDNSYTGFIMREETVVAAQDSGYVSYFQNENAKIRAGSDVYAISKQKLEPTEDDVGDEPLLFLNEEQRQSILQRTQNFYENFDSNKFSTVYSFKNDVDSILQNASKQSQNAKLNEMIANNASSIPISKSTRDGIIVMTFDGYEDADEESLCQEIFERSGYESHHVTSQTSIKQGDPVYKLITTDDWKIYIQLSEEAALELSETTMVKTRINKESETIWADFSIVEKSGDYYGRLCYDNSMIRYAKERYVTVELILTDQSGLKIPKSSVVEKPFYMVSATYLETIGAYNQGVLLQKDGEAVFRSVDIFTASDDEHIYLDPSQFEGGDVLIKPGSTETCVLQETTPLPGAYCVNKGYAVFKPVQILCENDDYYIVQEGLSQSLSNYDHIVQNADVVEEDEVIFQ